MKNTTKPILAVFGGAFDPPHNGHLSCVKQLLMSDEVAHVVVMPSAGHARDKKTESFEHRMNMLEALFSCWHKSDRMDVTVSDFESTIKKEKGQKYVYSYDVLASLQKSYPNYDVVLAVGKDNQDAILDFYRGDEILSEFGVLVVNEQESFEHSSALRARMKKEGMSKSVVRNLGAKVANYIVENKLYQSKK
jgi:nicotinate-nucleotide adenylyltransferase